MSNSECFSYITEEDQIKLNEFIANKCPDAVFLLRKDSAFVYVNKAVTEYLGYSLNELLKMGITDIDPWHDADEWPYRFKEIKDQRRLKVETQHKRKDGSVVHVEILASHLELSGEDFVLGFARDVTSKMKALADLKEIEERFITIFRRSSDMITILDDKGRILMANPPVCKALGYDESEMAGRCITEFMNDESIEYFKTLFPSVLKEQDVTCRIVFFRKNGNTLPIECNPLVLADKSDEITSIVVFQKETGTN